MVPLILMEEIADLEKVGYQIQLQTVGNRIYIIFKDYKLPSFYNSIATDLLVWTTISYPICAFDMFWVNKSLLLTGNRTPRAAGHIENHLGKQWRRYSIHPYQYKRWNPNEDSLTGYLVYINQRLNENL
ncbi:MAG: hypothetical protein JXQ93_01495 [Flavobacteriaceae bacterium]